MAIQPGVNQNQIIVQKKILENTKNEIRTPPFETFQIWLVAPRSCGRSRWLTSDWGKRSLGSRSWERQKEKRSSLINELVSPSTLFTTWPTHPVLAPWVLVLCGMRSQVTLLPLSFSVTVKVSPCLKAFFSLGNSFLVSSQSGRKASNTPPWNGFPGEGWSSWWSRRQRPHFWGKSHMLSSKSCDTSAH